MHIYSPLRKRSQGCHLCPQPHHPVIQQEIQKMAYRPARDLVFKRKYFRCCLIFLVKMAALKCEELSSGWIVTCPCQGCGGVWKQKCKPWLFQLAQGLRAMSVPYTRGVVPTVLLCKPFAKWRFACKGLSLPRTPHENCVLEPVLPVLHTRRGIIGLGVI